MFWPEGRADCSPHIAPGSKEPRRVYLSNKEHLLSVFAGSPNNAVDLSSDTDCISGHGILKHVTSAPQTPGCEPWLTLLSPNLWQARGPLQPCDTLLPKLDPLLYFLACDIIALASRTPLRTPILFSFPAIKHRAPGRSWAAAPRDAFGVFWGQRGHSSAPLPRWGRNDQSLCATGLAQFTAPPSALAHHSAWR